MSDTVIKIENLSKLYRIGTREAGYRTFRETLTDAFKAPFKAFGSKFSVPSSSLSSNYDTVWALKDVSFQVTRGEVVGIIGRNGAGKSTLLKVLSKITEPTEGRIELIGRVGSLLEVGTGFHPELTGHENVYLYGAILGMDRWEVTRKFDEIVAFAELERFIETPVKRYSSGMYMRLAFAVAAFLDPGILLIDEVLAVGDISFQKKCIGRIKQFTKGGKTVLIVSHNMNTIRDICHTGILIDNGTIVEHGKIDKIISTYIKTIQSKSSLSFNNEMIILYKFNLLKKGNKTVDYINTGEDLIIKTQFQSTIKEPVDINIGITIINEYEERFIHITEDDDDKELIKVKQYTTLRMNIKLNRVILPPGGYFIDIWIGSNKKKIDYFKKEKIAYFKVFYNKYTKRKNQFPAHIKIPQKSIWDISIEVPNDGVS